jgi:hypothetical protein
MEKMNAWLSLGANLGILTGLLLVAYQINQATESARLERQSESFVATMETMAMRASEELPERLARIMTNSADITDADVAALDGYLTREFTLAVRERTMAGLGYADDPAASASISKWAFVNLGNEAALRWWMHNQDASLNMIPELRDRVNAVLLEQGPAHATHHQRLITAMRTGPLFP